MDELLLFAAVGFAAQLVDGALGMAYGITATTVLLSMGVMPAVASASVHAAEVFTTGVSGVAHWRFGNIDRHLVWQLALPGMIGGVTGALLLATLPGEQIRPLVSVYLLVMGVVILRRALRTSAEIDRKRMPLVRIPVSDEPAAASSRAAFEPSGHVPHRSTQGAASPLATHRQPRERRLLRSRRGDDTCRCLRTTCWRSAAVSPASAFL